MITRYQNKNNRQQRVRAKVIAVSTRPRLTVFRSSKDIYGQIINKTGKVLAASNSLQLTKEAAKLNKTQQSTLVGEKLAQIALKNKITEVAFDRGAYLYHGRIKAFADGARKGGLKF